MFSFIPLAFNYINILSLYYKWIGNFTNCCFAYLGDMSGVSLTPLAMVIFFTSDRWTLYFNMKYLLRSLPRSLYRCVSINLKFRQNYQLPPVRQSLGKLTPSISFRHYTMSFYHVSNFPLTERPMVILLWPGFLDFVH